MSQMTQKPLESSELCKPESVNRTGSVNHHFRLYYSLISKQKDMTYLNMCLLSLNQTLPVSRSSTPLRSPRRASTSSWSAFSKATPRKSLNIAVSRQTRCLRRYEQHLSNPHPFNTSKAGSCHMDKGRGGTPRPGPDDRGGEGAHLHLAQQDRQWHLPLRSQQPPGDQHWRVHPLRLR